MLLETNGAPLGARDPATKGHYIARELTCAGNHTPHFLLVDLPCTRFSDSSFSVVIRLLPPSLTEEIFLKAIDAEIFKGVTWQKFIAGKRRFAYDLTASNYFLQILWSSC